MSSETDTRSIHNSSSKASRRMSKIGKKRSDSVVNEYPIVTLSNGGLLGCCIDVFRTVSNIYDTFLRK